MVSQQIVDIIIKAQDQASAAANKVDQSLQKIGKSSSKLSKIPGFDALKSKLTNVATTIDSKFGGAFSRARAKLSSFKNTVTSAASTLKSKFGSAVDGVRNKLNSLSNGAKSLSSAMSFLKGAVSMTAGMIGYDLVNSVVQSARASLNARSSIQAFASRLNMSATEVTAFQQSLDNLQNSYKKIDMDVVGQQATDMAYRLGLTKNDLTELTETTAIFTDAMQRNGRSAEDSMLAMSDAMDGQFVRLKEIGIGQDDLMRNGWSGDLNDKTGLLHAMNAALKEQHYDELAKSVDNLDEAWQVLSVTMGNLLEAILLPLTPVIVAVVNGIASVVEMIKGFVGILQGAFSALPQWMQDTAWATLLVIAIYAVGTAIWSSLIPALAAAAVAAIDFAVAMLANPFTWLIAALVAIALAVYEVGKAFGWWTDVSSMLEAIWAGVQRMWSAFINHPDVQAAISAISWALQTLWVYIQQAGQAVLEFFGITTNGDFDIVRAYIDNIGAAWNAMTAPIRAVIGVLQILYPYLLEFYNGALVPLGELIMSVLVPAWEAILVVWSAVSEAVLQLMDVFSQFQDGQASLIDVVAAAVNVLMTLWSTAAQQLSLLVLTLAANMLSWAWTAGSNYVNGILTWLSQLPGRVYTYLLNVGTRIVSAGVQWVNNGKQKASQFVNGVISFIKQLPGKVYTQLIAVVSRIVSAGAQWVSNARSKASEVVSTVYNKIAEIPGKISSALSGVVSAITAPFQNAYNTLCGIVDNIKSKAAEVANISLPAFGGDLPMGGDIVTDAMGGDLEGTSSEPIEVNENINITLDLINVPSQIDTDTLIQAMNNKDVLSALVRNRDFQSLDAKIKTQIAAKSRRYTGV